MHLLSGWARCPVALLVLGAPASALAGFDGTGPPLPVSSDDVRVPLVGWRAARPLQGAFSAGFVAEVMGEPLVRMQVDPVTGRVSYEGVLTGVAGGRAGVRYALTDRIEVAASLPVWPIMESEVNESIGGLGDMNLSAPINLVDRGELAVAVVPELSLPTGTQTRYLGDPAVSIGGHGIVEGGVGSALFLAWGGLDFRGFTPEDNYLPGLGAYGGLGAGYAFDRRFGVHAAWRFDARLQSADGLPDEAPRRVTGSELSVTTRGVLFNRWYVEGGVGGATQRAPGAAAGRFWLGLGKSVGGEEPQPLRVDLPLSLLVTDPAGAPVVDAVVRIGQDELARTDGQGRALIRRRWRKGDVLVAQAPGLQATTLDGPADPQERGSDEATLVLAWSPVPVLAKVQDAEGRPLAAALSARGDAGEVVPDVRTTRLMLEPGAWTVRAEIDGYGAQERGVLLPPRSAGEELLFILQPVAGEGALDVSVVDVDGAPVDGATLGLGGRPVGDSGSGGTLRIEGLADAPLELDAQADTYRELTRPGVQPDGEPIEIVLARERGAVQVVVRGPDGLPVQDASARFLGADRLGPFQIGDRGSRTFVLRPGPWQLLVSSSESGLQQRALDIPERDTALQVVEVILQPPESGDTELTVRVVDVDNRPVPGAAVRLDGVPYGTTSTGGELVIADLREGPRSLSIEGEWLEPADVDVDLAGGLQERTLVASWKEGTTLIMARGPQGMVEDATARAFGAQAVPPTPLGRDGVEYVGLGTGDWDVLVSSPDLGFQQLGVAIPEGSRSLHVVEAVLNPGEAGVGRLELRIVDPRGQPVSGAEISLDDVPLGATSSSGSLSLVELATGTRSVRVQRPPYADKLLQIPVTTSESPHRVQLEWGVGAVEVQVTGQGQPVSDARLRLGGPRFVPATPVDDRGTRLLGLEPGSWQLLASSPSFAPAQRTFQVPTEPGLTQVQIGLTPPQAELSEVLVRLQGPDGQPISDASVQVDGGTPVSVGEGGLAVLTLTPGTHRLEVLAPTFQRAVYDDQEFRPGVSERILALAYEPRDLGVKVSGPQGPLAGATVSLDGPVEVDPVATGADGRVDLALRPGRWSVLASAPDLGVQEAQVELLPGAEPQTVELSLLPAQVDLAGAVITVRNTIYFDTGKASLKAESEPILDEVAATLKAHPELVRLVVEGHTDPTGGVAFNVQLSRDRARAVVDALVERGVAPERLQAQGFGPTRPVSDNDSAQGRARNRRVELRAETGEPR